MRYPTLLLHSIIGLLFWECNTQAEVKAETVPSTSVVTEQPVSTSSDTTLLKVSAYLIYEDGSISSFDVLNDKTKALWNSIIGAGDAEKPSTMIKIRPSGKLDGLRVRIFNGKKKVVDQSLPEFSSEKEFIIKNTGCQVVRVHVADKAHTVYENNIPFECGE